MTGMGSGYNSKAHASAPGREAGSAVVLLELRPGSQHRLATILLGSSIVLLILVASITLTQATNPDSAWIFLFGLGLFVLSIPVYVFTRMTRKLEVSGEGVKFFRGSTVKRSLPWNRVEKVQWGETRRPSPTGKWRVSAYVTILARPSSQSVRILGRLFNVQSKEIENAALAAADWARLHSIPVEEKELRY